jgi:hypothetical protein
MPTMLKSNARRVVLGLTLALGLGLCTAWGQDKGSSAPAKPVDAASSKRIAYLVQHGAAKDFAAVLTKHFKGDAEVQVSPESAANCLLINAPAPIFDEVVKLLAQLDRPPQTVVVEVWVAELPPPSDDAKPEAVKDLDVKDFNGPAADVVTKLDARQRNGQIGTLRRVQLTLVEGRRSTVYVGENKPYVTSMTATARGLTTRMIARQAVGTQALATARVAGDKQIEIDLNVTDARMVPNLAMVIGKDDMGAPVHATEFVTARLESKLSVRSGRAVAAQGVKTISKSNKEQTLVVVTARIVDPNAPFEAEAAPLNPFGPGRGGRGGRGPTPPQPPPQPSE